MPTITYEQIPALRAYIDRVGAHQLNFKKFMVRTYHENNYYVEKAFITINADFSITCGNPEFAPTENEAIDIASALQRFDFPTCTQATPQAAKQKRQALGNPEHLYEFYDRTTGNVIMMQQRVMRPTGKAFIPWTMWSDGDWRAMEPDQKLPFWKPLIENKIGQRIMVHEGAKTACFVHHLCTDPEEAAKLALHPWANELVKYEHWGMIGGALAPHRTAYDELRKAKPSEVVYVCDNDKPGKRVLKPFSFYYGHALKGIMFDERWPDTWDLADEMPAGMFSTLGVWTGPTLLKLTQLATWATEKKPNPEGGRHIVVIRNEFVEEWVHCITPEVYVHLDWPNVILNGSEFNNKVKPFSDTADTASLLKSDAPSKSAILKYSPAVKPGIYNDGTGNRYMNTHVPGNITALKGNTEPWDEFMEHLIPVEKDRDEALRWCATLIARPDIKMLYGMLLISEVQGVGKSTLGEKILALLIGEWNVSYPSENEVVESSFNYWSAHKRLAIIHEIYAGHSSKAYNKLKSMITDRYIQVNKKYQAAYEIENWIHIFACSNSPRALKLSSDDRRWFVPKVTTDKKTEAYWTTLNDWLVKKQGLRIIKWWATEYLKTHAPVIAGAEAPWSTAKQDVVEEGYSAAEILVAGFLDKVKEELPPATFLMDVDLVTLVKDHLYESRQNDRLPSAAQMRKLAKDRGWHVGEARTGRWGKRLYPARIISLDPVIAETDPAEISAAPLNVGEKGLEWFTIAGPAAGQQQPRRPTS